MSVVRSTGDPGDVADMRPSDSCSYVVKVFGGVEAAQKFSAACRSLGVEATMSPLANSCIHGPGGCADGRLCRKHGVPLISTTTDETLCAVCEKAMTTQASPDPIVARVIAKHAARSKRGVTKYGVTLNRPDLSRLDWLRHLSEELLDAACYCERLIRDEEGATMDAELRGRAMVAAARLAWPGQNGEWPDDVVHEAGVLLVELADALEAAERVVDAVSDSGMFPIYNATMTYVEFSAEWWGRVKHALARRGGEGGGE
jgi:uncharacterized Zn finger protein (UPF0148 family)